MGVPPFLKYTICPVRTQITCTKNLQSPQMCFDSPFGICEGCMISPCRWWWGGWCRCPAPSVPTGPPSIPAGRWMLALDVSLQPPLSFPLGGKGSPGGFQHLCQLQSWPGLLFALSILFSASPLSLLTKLVSEPIFPAPPSSGVPIPEWVDRTEGYGFAFPFLTAWMTCYTLRTYRQ